MAAAASTVVALTPAAAQVMLDGTTGPAGALAGPDYRIGAGLGRRAGGNLFHSFARFGLRSGESATFSGPAGIENVISRVTGGARSDIDGVLRSTIPGADLWFLNPAGVVFGPNARLEVLIRPAVPPRARGRCQVLSGPRCRRAGRHKARRVF